MTTGRTSQQRAVWTPNTRTNAVDTTKPIAVPTATPTAVARVPAEGVQGGRHGGPGRFGHGHLGTEERLLELGPLRSAVDDPTPSGAVDRPGQAPVDGGQRHP